MSGYGHSYFVPNGSSSTRIVSHFGRIRLGEVFMICDNTFELVCFHCSREFHDFGEFTLHAHEHLRGIGVALTQPERNSKTEIERLRLVDESNEVDLNDIFAGTDRTMDYDDDDNHDNHVQSASEDLDNGEDDDSCDQNESMKSFPGIYEDAVARLAKENFELDNSPEAKEYSHYIYNNRFPCVKGMHRCSKCAYSTKKRDHLKRHMFSHLRRKIFKCMLCSIRFSHILHMRQHRRFHEKEKAKRKKEISKINVDDEVDEEDEKDEDEKVDNAEIDPYRDVKAMLMANGIKIKNTQEATEYLGWLCGRNTVTKKEGTGNYSCPQCTYSSLNSNHVKRHIAMHFKTKIFTCLKCKKPIRNIENCRMHMKSVHGKQMERFQFVDFEKDADEATPPKRQGNECESSKTPENYDDNDTDQD